eukprot:6482155-Amphidinium_carterae.1
MVVIIFTLVATCLQGDEEQLADGHQPQTFSSHNEASRCNIEGPTVRVGLAMLRLSMTQRCGKFHVVGKSDCVLKHLQQGRAAPA